jgi:hypothetical protein
MIGVSVMRDTRKSESYFTEYTAYERERIQKKKEKMIQCSDETKIIRISSSLFLYQMNLLIASFSKGAEKDELKTLFQDCCSTVQRMAVLTYEDALRLSSFSVILECRDAFQKAVERFPTVYKGDKLLNGLCSFIVSGTAAWEGVYQFPRIYGAMEDVLNAESKSEKEKALLNYLNDWYERNQTSAWYDTLNSPNDVYYGYWSFESAAIAAIFGLNCDVLAQSKYFPKL